MASNCPRLCKSRSQGGSAGPLSLANVLRMTITHDRGISVHCPFSRRNKAYVSSKSICLSYHDFLNDDTASHRLDL